MSPRTLGLWCALAEIDPWDENRADLRNGALAASVFQALGCKWADGRAAAPEDFMRYAKLQRDPSELQRENDEQVAAALRTWLESNSGHAADPERDHLKEA